MAQVHDAVQVKLQYQNHDHEQDQASVTQYAPSDHGSSDTEKGDRRLSNPDDNASKPVPLTDPSMFPDGGLQAWLCVGGGAAGLFCSFGWINCIGVFQDYYVRGPLSQYSPSAVGWISSCEVFFMMFGGPFVGWWMDNYGPRYMLLVGTFLHVFGLMMASISKEYYQFLLSQGICSAIGACMLFTPSQTCVATYFFRKRGLAVGLVAAGSSLGGVIFPIVVSRLIPRVGFGWAMRVCAFIILALMIFANLTITSRLPPSGRKFKPMAFIRPLRELPFLFIIVGVFLFYYGMFIPFSFIVSDAVHERMSVNMSDYLVSLVNAGSILGRTLPGLIGDRVGRFNTMVGFCGLSGVLIVALWIPSSSNAVEIVFAPLFGFASGAAVGLMPALVAQISDVRDIGVRTGTVFGFSSIAALTGTPIGGALLADGVNGYLYMKIFCGVLAFAGTFGFLASRVSLAGWKFRVKV